MQNNFLINLYKFLMVLISPILWMWIKYRIINGKEEYHRTKERFGYPTIARPNNAIIWLHGASVGEVKILFTLAQQSKQ